jgi:hypothetical protein
VCGASFTLLLRASFLPVHACLPHAILFRVTRTISVAQQRDTEARTYAFEHDYALD